MYTQVTQVTTTTSVIKSPPLKIESGYKQLWLTELLKYNHWNFVQPLKKCTTTEIVYNHWNLSTTIEIVYNHWKFALGPLKICTWTNFETTWNTHITHNTRIFNKRFRIIRGVQLVLLPLLFGSYYPPIRRPRNSCFGSSAKSSLRNIVLPIQTHWGKYLCTPSVHYQIHPQLLWELNGRQTTRWCSSQVKGPDLSLEEKIPTSTNSPCPKCSTEILGIENKRKQDITQQKYRITSKT